MLKFVRYINININMSASTSTSTSTCTCTNTNTNINGMETLNHCSEKLERNLAFPLLILIKI